MMFIKKNKVDNKYWEEFETYFTDLVKMDENECTQPFSLCSPQDVLVSEEATRKSDTKLESSAQLKNDKILDEESTWNTFTYDISQVYDNMKKNHKQLLSILKKFRLEKVLEADDQ